jgi:cobaltochelatase CobS
MSETTGSTLIADAGDGKIECRICGQRTHVIQKHLKDDHESVTVEHYQAQFPDAAIYSQKAIDAIALRQRKGVPVSAPTVTVTEETTIGEFAVKRAPLHQVFGLGSVKAALSRKGAPIPIQIFEGPEALKDFEFKADPNYVWSIDLLKKILLALEMNIPCFIWGHAGTGKSTAAMQVCAATGRPAMRVQHTANTEESHVLGQWIVRDGETKFELGPLPYCMKHGLTYIADEYDFAMPQVLSLYQPVLEGNPLVIKEADHENRVVAPHPLFRMIATGNTNGTGDDSGLYQGTRLQNAANFERFGVVEQVHYPEKRVEVRIVAGQAEIPDEKAEALVNYGNMIREAFANGKIGSPISPRALINAGKIAKRLGTLAAGLDLAYINRLSRVDQEVAREARNRIITD